MSPTACRAVIAFCWGSPSKVPDCTVRISESKVEIFERSIIVNEGGTLLRSKITGCGEHTMKPPRSLLGSMMDTVLLSAGCDSDAIQK